MGANEHGDMYLITMLAHSSGQWIKSMLPIKLPNTKDSRVNEHHLLGSAITYLRRYAWSAIIGLSTEEDDDANSLQGTTYQSKSSKTKVELSPMIEEKPPTISSEQVEELTMLMEKCGKEFKSKVSSFLSRNGISDYSMIPSSLFLQIKGDALARQKEGASS